jgi:hypothetical protein
MSGVLSPQEQQQRRIYAGFLSSLEHKGWSSELNSSSPSMSGNDNPYSYTRTRAALSMAEKGDASYFLSRHAESETNNISVHCMQHRGNACRLVEPGQQRKCTLAAATVPFLNKRAVVTFW